MLKGNIKFDTDEGKMQGQNPFYSEEASEIIGKLPSWTIRWGITVIVGIMVGILIACWLIKYPQTIDSPITITTLNPPADLLARSDGKLDRIFVSDKEMVEKDQLIVLMYNTANYQDVCTVNDSLKKNLGKDYTEFVQGQWLLKDYQLGDLQQTYEAFRLICMDYRHYVVTDNIRKKKALLAAQIEKNKKYRGQLDRKNKLTKEDAQYEYANEQRYEMLYKKGLISKSDYENAVRGRLQTEQNKSGSEATLIATDLDIMQMKQQMIELDIQYDNEKTEYERQLNQYRQQLITAIEQWKYQYLIQTPIDGTITFVKYWSENQQIANKERFATVIPLDSIEIIGRMAVPTASFGKVATGQVVNVRLNSYPYMEYGVLKGKIRNISSVPDDYNNYVVEIVFPNGMTTTYQKKLNMIQKMDGVAQIITEDMRLIERFIQPIKELFNR